jgi:hypothetical protein
MYGMVLNSVVCFMMMSVCTGITLAADIPDGPFTGTVSRAFSCALNSLGISEDGLRFKKTWDTDEFRLSRVQRSIDDPVFLLDTSHSLFSVAQTGSTDDILYTITGVDAVLSAFDTTYKLLEYLEKTQNTIQLLYAGSSVTVSQQWLSTALLTSFSRVTRNRTVLPDVLAAGADKNVIDSTLEKVDMWLYAKENDTLATVQLLKQLPVEEIIAVARSVLGAVISTEYTDIDSLDRKHWKKKGVLIGSPGPDIYTNSLYWCIIDPGGDDLYIDNAGFAGMSVHKLLSVIIDLAGDDVYRGASCGSAGSAVLGVSLVADLAGNDVYTGDSLSQGAGIGGVGILYDRAGRDYYRSRRYSQGMAFFGLGALIDDAGNDTYETGSSGQGFGSVRGYGILCDSQGNDLYSAGRDQADYGRYGSRYISISQGAGMGMRPYASGGIGAVIDKSGNDVYIADVFGQGVGYWYGLGMLIDVAGQDTYQLYEYGQGAGIHLACGTLLDGAGNDVYTLRNGIGQGASHDFAVGYLRDYSGNDQYQGHITVQGSSINNGVALLVDDSGNDWYSSFSEISQGFGRFENRRDFGSLGICLDAQGSDWYHDVKRNAFIEIRGLQGICVDYPDEQDQEKDE